MAQYEGECLVFTFCLETSSYIQPMPRKYYSQNSFGGVIFRKPREYLTLKKVRWIRIVHLGESRNSDTKLIVHTGFKVLRKLMGHIFIFTTWYHKSVSNRAAPLSCELNPKLEGLYIESGCYPTVNRYWKEVIRFYRQEI